MNHMVITAAFVIGTILGAGSTVFLLQQRADDGPTGIAGLQNLDTPAVAALGKPRLTFTPETIHSREPVVAERSQLVTQVSETRHNASVASQSQQPAIPRHLGSPMEPSDEEIRRMLAHVEQMNPGL